MFRKTIENLVWFRSFFFFFLRLLNSSYVPYFLLLTNTLKLLSPTNVEGPGMGLFHPSLLIKALLGSWFPIKSLLFSNRSCTLVFLEAISNNLFEILFISFCKNCQKTSKYICKHIKICRKYCRWNFLIFISPKYSLQVICP